MFQRSAPYPILDQWVTFFSPRNLQIKFQLSAPTECAGSSKKETSLEGRGGGLQAAVFFPSSPWLEKRRPGAHPHGSWKIACRIPYPTLDQWFT